MVTMTCRLVKPCCAGTWNGTEGTLPDHSWVAGMFRLGILLGTRLWYSFYGKPLDDDAAFLSKARELMREIGNKGKLPELDSRPHSDRSKSPAGVHDTNGGERSEALDTASNSELEPA